MSRLITRQKPSDSPALYVAQHCAGTAHCNTTVEVNPPGELQQLVLAARESIVLSGVVFIATDDIAGSDEGNSGSFRCANFEANKLPPCGFVRKFR